jgi:hypothetical protein
MTDWVPIMLVSSISLGCLPDAVGVASWLPTDGVSQAILDVTFGNETPELALNLVHPRPTPWHHIMEMTSDHLLQSGVTTERLPLVTVDEWFSKLSEASANASDEIMKRIVSPLSRVLSSAFSK